MRFDGTGFHPTIIDPLHVATIYGLVDILDWCHPPGLDFDIGNNHYTPLMQSLWAAGQGNEQADVIRILIEKAADVNTRHVVGPSLTILMFAFKYDTKQAIKFLLEQEKTTVDDELDKDGSTMLQIAIHRGSKDIVQLLQRRGGTIAKFNGVTVVESIQQHGPGTQMALIAIVI